MDERRQAAETADAGKEVSFRPGITTALDAMMMKKAGYDYV
jgi:hypothetical protein